MLSSFELQAQHAVPAPVVCDLTTNTMQVLVTRYNQLDSSACSVVMSFYCLSQQLNRHACGQLHVALILAAKPKNTW